MLGVAAAVSVASAAIKDTQLFESTFTDFVADTADEDASELVNHSTVPLIGIPYPCESFGEKYLSLDTGDATLWRTLNVSGSVYFDMAVQFNASSTALDVSSVEDAKIAVYLNAASNIVIVAGAENDENRTPTNYVTTATVPSGTWARLTISAVQTETEGLAFQVRVNGTLLATESGTDAFPCLTSNTVVTQVGLKGSGSLDNFVARTTDPFIDDPVATIGGEGYANLDDALAEADANTVVTLQADHAGTVALAAGATYKIAAGEYQFGGFVGADGVVVSSTTADGVTTYTGALGVAKIGTTGYSTFAEAYAVAKETAGTTIVLLAEVDETITAVDGETMNFSISKGEFTNSSIELVVPAGVTVNIASSSAVGGVTALSGKGRIVTSTQARTLASLVRQSTWCGTLEVKNATWANNIVNLDEFGNANSSVYANFITFAPASSGNGVKALEIGSNGLTLEGSYQSGTFTFPCALTGSGKITVKVSNSASGTSLKKINFTGDVSGFTGSIAIDSTSNVGVNFGTGDGGVTGKNQIGVTTGAAVTVAAGKTWTASDFIFNGNVTLNGSLVDLDDSTVGKVWNNKTDAVLRVNTAGACSLGSVANWRGTYIVGYAASGAFNPNNCGNGNSTVALAADLGKDAYFGTGSAVPLTISPTIRLDTDVTIKNGYAVTEANKSTCLVTFNKLTGRGKLTTFATGNANVVYYKINSLEDFTGSLDIKAHTEVEIVNVALAASPAAETLAVPVTLGAEKSAVNSPTYTVTGSDEGGKLVYATLDNTSGLYLAVAQVGDVCYATYDAAFAAAATAEAEEVLALVDTQYPAPEGWKIDSETGNYVKKVYVAKIEGGASYETLADAVTNATSGATVTLLGNITLDARVEPNVGANTTLAINLGGFTITREGTSGNGSVFDVKSGSVVITNGTIDCTQDDTAIVADGVYAITVRSGAALTLDDLTVTVDSQAGACVYPFNGASVTILGGTYGNETADAYQYHANWTGMAVNQANVATQLITIYGGSFYKVDPSLGDDSWADGEGTFLATGKATTLEGDYWVVDTATYTVRFLDGENGNVLSSQTVSYGETATAPAENPTKAGYAFKGWSGDVTAEITADTDFIAQWNAYVAQIEGGDSYETVVAALEAAQDGQTVKLLANTCERVYATVNCNVTLDINGKTMTSPVDDVIVKNGTGTLTIQDSAETLGLVQSTINGEDLGVAVWVRQGSAVIKSGVFENNSNYEATVYVSNGASCTIEGGTFSNVATGEYHWKAGWKPITLNVQNGHASGAAAISVSGGSFTTDPANGDDKFGGTFLADGKATTLEGGYYVVGEAETPVEPGETDGKTYETQADAEAAAAQVTIAPAADVATALGEDAAVKAAYLAKFEAKAVSDGTGGYKVEVGLTTDAVAALTTDATDAAETVADSLTAIAATAAGAQTEVTVQNAEPGFYYSIGYATSLGQEYTEGARALAGANGTVTLATPAKAENATAGFYKVFVNVQDK